jgi:hypothetical protein
VQSLGSNLSLEQEAFACDIHNILQQRTTYGVLEATVVKKQPSFGSFRNEAFLTRFCQHPLYDSGQHELFPAQLGEVGIHLLTLEVKPFHFTWRYKIGLLMYKSQKKTRRLAESVVTCTP